MESKINVTLRMKPLSEQESINDKNHLWSNIKSNSIMNSRTKEVFTFDRVFGPDVSTQ